MGRAPCCDKANVKKGPWSPEEDAKLRHFIETKGTGGNWITLPRKAGLVRCGKSCRLRWINYLRPNIKHGGFTEEEEKMIVEMHRKVGTRWSMIAAQLPGRTDNDIKNYWNTRLKKKLADNGINSPGRQPQQVQQSSVHIQPTVPIFPVGSVGHGNSSPSYADMMEFLDYRQHRQQQQQQQYMEQQQQHQHQHQHQQQQQQHHHHHHQQQQQQQAAFLAQLHVEQQQRQQMLPVKYEFPSDEPLQSRALEIQKEICDLIYPHATMPRLRQQSEDEWSPVSGEWSPECSDVIHPASPEWTLQFNEMPFHHQFNEMPCR